MSYTRIVGALTVATIALLTLACSSDDSGTTSVATISTQPLDLPSGTGLGTETPVTNDPTGTDVDTTDLCSAAAITAAMESGDGEGSISGMADDPVATATSNNRVLTTLFAAISAAELVDTLNNAAALTVFAPTDCAFQTLDPTTLDNAIADPTGLLTRLLDFHVVPQRLEPAALAGTARLTTLSGEVLPVVVDGDTITLDNGAATVVAGPIETANATVYLIDHVLVPPSVAG